MESGAVVNKRALGARTTTELKLIMDSSRLPLERLVGLTESIMGLVEKGNLSNDFIDAGSNVARGLRAIIKDESKDMAQRLQAARAFKRLSDYAFSSGKNSIEVLDIIACDKTPVPGTSDEIHVTIARELDDTIDLAEALIRKAGSSS